MAAAEQELRQFIVDNFLFGELDRELSSDESLLERGIIDSTGILELVLFIEDKYGISINDNELIPANLDSLRNMVRFIDDKIHRAPGKPLLGVEEEEEEPNVPSTR